MRCLVPLVLVVTALGPSLAEPGSDLDTNSNNTLPATNVTSISVVISPPRMPDRSAAEKYLNAVGRVVSGMRNLNTTIWWSLSLSTLAGGGICETSYVLRDEELNETSCAGVESTEQLLKYMREGYNKYSPRNQVSKQLLNYYEVLNLVEQHLKDLNPNNTAHVGCALQQTSEQLSNLTGAGIGHSARSFAVLISESWDNSTDYRGREPTDIRDDLVSSTGVSAIVMMHLNKSREEIMDSQSYTAKVMKQIATPSTCIVGEGQVPQFTDNCGAELTTTSEMPDATNSPSTSPSPSPPPNKHVILFTVYDHATEAAHSGATLRSYIDALNRSIRTLVPEQDPLQIEIQWFDWVGQGNPDAVLVKEKQGMDRWLEVFDQYVDNLKSINTLMNTMVSAKFSDSTLYGDPSDSSSSEPPPLHNLLVVSNRFPFEQIKDKQAGYNGTGQLRPKVLSINTAIGGHRKVIVNECRSHNVLNEERCMASNDKDLIAKLLKYMKFRLHPYTPPIAPTLPPTSKPKPSSPSGQEKGKEAERDKKVSAVLWVVIVILIVIILILVIVLILFKKKKGHKTASTPEKVKPVSTVDRGTSPIQRKRKPHQHTASLSVLGGQSASSGQNSPATGGSPSGAEKRAAPQSKSSKPSVVSQKAVRQVASARGSAKGSVKGSASGDLQPKEGKSILREGRKPSGTPLSERTGDASLSTSTTAMGGGKSERSETSGRHGSDIALKGGSASDGGKSAGRQWTKKA